MTDNSVLIPSTVHVLNTMGLLTDVQPAVALPPTAPTEHATTATQNNIIVQHYKAVPTINATFVSRVQVALDALFLVAKKVRFKQGLIDY